MTSWAVGSRPTLEFGGYLGTDEGGEVEIEALPGDIVRWGQKDGSGKHTLDRFGIEEDDRDVRRLTEAGARATFKPRT